MTDTECVFCFEELNKYDTVILNCPHKYHLHCIVQWNNKSKNYTKVCPQCNVVGEIINIEKGEETYVKPATPIMLQMHRYQNIHDSGYLIQATTPPPPNRHNIPFICCSIL